MLSSLRPHHFPPIFLPFLGARHWMAAERCVNLYPSARLCFGIAIVGSGTGAVDTRPPSNHRDFWRDTGSGKSTKTCSLRTPPCFPPPASRASRRARFGPSLPTRHMCASGCPDRKGKSSSPPCLMQSWQIAKPNFISCFASLPQNAKPRWREDPDGIGHGEVKQRRGVTNIPVISRFQMI